MYLKKLELHGFKSFPDKTALQFNQGSTIIVGPNGSGKSNITDAMRWALGELSSKSLRGNKMEDVIFAGADGVRPMGFAEVSVTFDNSEEPKSINSEYDEITVTRRYYRSGDSAYFINRKPVRLKDITELFMNTGIGREGYSIIGQGKIAEIISKKSEDRRNIFEESAGITKYRYRKNEAQKKLGETENNMIRIGDIRSELEARIGPLEREAEKARRYLELYDRKKKLDVSLWISDMDKTRANLSKTETDTKMSEHELEMADDTMKQLEEKIDRLYESSRGNKEETQRLREEINGLRGERARLDNDSRLIENNTQHAKRSLEDEIRLTGEAETSLYDSEELFESLIENLKALTASLEEAADKCSETSDKRMKALSERNSRDDVIESLFRDRQRKESELGDLRVRLNVLKNMVSDQSKRNVNIGAEISERETEFKDLESRIASVSETIAGYESRIRDAEADYAGAAQALEKNNSYSEKLRAEKASLHARSEALESRISAMERMLEHFEGYSNSVRFVMGRAGAGKLSGIRGPLSSLIKADGKYTVALETSFGAALQNIVTEDERSAKAAISALKAANAGRATFYPMTTVKAQRRGEELSGAAGCPGFIGFADELVECDTEYRGIVSSIVGRVCVFDNIDNASNMARARGWRIRAVTLDGQQINAGGSFTGGSARRDSGMLSRTAQIEDLRKEKERVDSEEKRASDRLSSSEKERAELSIKRADADEKRRLMESLASVERTGLGELEAKRKVTGDLIARLRADESEYENNRLKSSEDIKRIGDEISRCEAELKDLIERRETVAGERGEYDVLADELTEDLSAAQIRLAELTKDKQSAENSVSECGRRISALKEEIARRRAEAERLESEIAGASHRTEELREEGAENEVRLKILEERLASLDAEGDRLEGELNELRRREREQSAKKEILFIAHTKNENKLESIRGEIDKMTGRLWDEYELTYGGATELAEAGELENFSESERAAAKARLTEMKSRLKSLGHVNLSAVEEYAETKERYDYIKAQTDDLEASRRELESVIRDIENDMRRMFIDAFEKINKNFGEVFRDLFGGGRAELILTDPDDVLTSGIEISAAPPGKSIKSLSLLSGGEQAFIAIALIFALVKFNPAPFCIFDEIEAALDEVNVARVANYVRRYSSEMQIIMITHRRGTMDIADTLYGVTMPKSGVSKVFTLDVNRKAENEEFLNDKNKA